MKFKEGDRVSVDAAGINGTVKFVDCTKGEPRHLVAYDGLPCGHSHGWYHYKECTFLDRDNKHVNSNLCCKRASANPLTPEKAEEKFMERELGLADKIVDEINEWLLSGATKRETEGVQFWFVGHEISERLNELIGFEVHPVITEVRNSFKDAGWDDLWLDYELKEWHLKKKV